MSQTISHRLFEQCSRKLSKTFDGTIEEVEAHISQDVLCFVTQRIRELDNLGVHAKQSCSDVISRPIFHKFPNMEIYARKGLVPRKRKELDQ